MLAHGEMLRDKNGDTPLTREQRQHGAAVDLLIEAGGVTDPGQPDAAL